MKSKKIGLWGCIFILVGGMLGSAIFSLSGLAIYYAGPASILSWIIAAIIMGAYGLICVELAIRFPKSGGVYVFPVKAFSEDKNKAEILGFVSACGFINSNIVAMAFSAIYMGTYLSVGFPIFQNMQIPIAIISIFFAFILNCISFRKSGYINTVLVIVMIATLVIYIVLSFSSNNFDASYFSPFFTQGSKGELGFIKVVPTVMVAYGSIVSIAFIASEVKSPEKNIPKSVLIAIVMILVIYLAIIIATLGLVNVQFLEENPGMRYIPLYAAAFTKLSNYAFLPQLISISACLAIFTTIFVMVSLIARTFQALAYNGVIPKKLSKNNKNEVPAFASAVAAIPAMIISCFPNFTEMIVGFGALFGAITICINCISLIHVKKKNIEVNNKFVAPFGIALPTIILVIIVLCYIPDILHGGLTIWIYSILWYLVCFILYYYRKKAGKIDTEE